ncbi:MAG: hypothetical protein A3D92_00125 [Bacteroidetes bacterium RIFCSPHIGHO2_02_FULL_44_7]|nr:MAG: hypothetical protein A3D92_00125 [Bacteroidetes bacterium RIFCSPHIGHO2_02_FULL_44_7]
MILLAILFPGISFLIRGKILHFIVCILLQLTVIGWLPAAIWAVASLNDSRNEQRLKEMERRLRANR